MNIVLQGVVHGKTIELRGNPGVPDGQEVEVLVKIIQPAAPWGEGIRRSAGAAVDVPDFDKVFAEIEHDRKASKFRETTA